MVTDKIKRIVQMINLVCLMLLPVLPVYGAAVHANLSPNKGADLANPPLLVAGRDALRAMDPNKESVHASRGLTIPEYSPGAQVADTQVQIDVSGDTATFIVTDVGQPLSGVEIFIDSASVGTTDAAGKVVVNGLTKDMHSWTANYDGGEIGAGSLAIFDYSIEATGEAWPARSFTYHVTVQWTQKTTKSGSNSGADWGTKETGSWYTWDCGGGPLGLLATKKKWVGTEINYGITFKELPSLSVSLDCFTLCDIDDIHGPVVFANQTRSGADAKVWVYGDLWTILPPLPVLDYCVSPWNVKFDWLATGLADRSRSFTGDASAKKGEPDKEIYVAPAVPGAIDTTYSFGITVAGDTKSGKPPNVIELGGIEAWMDGRKLMARSTYTETWSATDVGTGGLSDAELDTLIAVSHVEAPQGDTEYVLSSITLGGITYQDNGLDDADPRPGYIDTEDLSVRMVGNELWGSMRFRAPTALIDSITPPVTRFGEPITFQGHLESATGEPITTTNVLYHWRSHLAGDLGDTPVLITDSLLPGRHKIFFKGAVEQNATYIWSAEDIGGMRVNQKPRAYISYVDGVRFNNAGDIVGTVDSPISFGGLGLDNDGTIVAYEWEIDGQIVSTQQEFTYTFPDAQRGDHIIVFRVQDNDGEWSAETSAPIKVIRPPVLLVYGVNEVSLENWKLMAHWLDKAGWDVWLVDYARVSRKCPPPPSLLVFVFVILLSTLYGLSVIWMSSASLEDDRARRALSSMLITSV